MLLLGVVCCSRRPLGQFYESISERNIFDLAHITHDTLGGTQQFDIDKDGNLSDEKVELTLKDGGFEKGEDGKYTKTYENIAPGKYTVTETDSDVEGYDFVAEQSTTEGEATVAAGKTETIEKNLDCLRSE